MAISNNGASFSQRFLYPLEMFVGKIHKKISSMRSNRTLDCFLVAMISEAAVFFSACFDEEMWTP